MRFLCHQTQLPDGRWQVRYDGSDLGVVTATAETSQAALEKMRGELRYRLELCPCSGESYQHIEVELETKPV